MLYKFLKIMLENVKSIQIPYHPTPHKKTVK